MSKLKKIVFFIFLAAFSFYEMRGKCAYANANSVPEVARDALVEILVELGATDVWNHIFHKKGRNQWSKLGFYIGRAAKYRMCHSVTVVIMAELQNFLFDKNEKFNEKNMKKISFQFEKLLREWWLESPLDPMSSLDIGVWKTLVKLYTTTLEQNMKGSDKLKKLEDVLYDPKLKLIKQWTDAQHVHIMKKSGSTKEKMDALKALRLKYSAEDRTENPPPERITAEG